MNKQKGIVTLEALLVVPLWIACGLAAAIGMGALYKEALLQEAVRETVKVVAAASAITHALPTLPPEWVSLYQIVPRASVLRTVQSPALHAGWITPLLRTFVDDPTWLKADDIRIERVALPIDDDRMFGIVVALTWHVPILRRDIVVRASAIERCWCGA